MGGSYVKAISNFSHSSSITIDEGDIFIMKSFNYVESDGNIDTTIEIEFPLKENEPIKLNFDDLVYFDVLSDEYVIHVSLEKTKELKETIKILKNKSEEKDKNLVSGPIESNKAPQVDKLTSENLQKSYD